MNTAISCYRIHVSGRVQGVAFRHYTKQMADQLGVTGWVRNRPDGSVETMICGSTDALIRMQSWLTEGPHLAQVEEMQVSEVATDNFTDFEIRY